MTLPGNWAIKRSTLSAYSTIWGPSVIGTFVSLLKYITNRRGPNTDPCGIPKSTDEY